MEITATNCAQGEPFHWIAYALMKVAWELLA